LKYILKTSNKYQYTKKYNKNKE